MNTNTINVLLYICSSELRFSIDGNVLCCRAVMMVVYLMLSRALSRLFLLRCLWLVHIHGSSSCWQLSASRRRWVCWLSVAAVVSVSTAVSYFTGRSVTDLNEWWTKPFTISNYPEEIQFRLNCFPSLYQQTSSFVFLLFQAELRTIRPKPCLCVNIIYKQNWNLL